jgi:hypothetical protein
VRGINLKSDRRHRAQIREFMTGENSSGDDSSSLLCSTYLLIMLLALFWMMRVPLNSLNVGVIICNEVFHKLAQCGTVCVCSRSAGWRSRGYLYRTKILMASDSLPMYLHFGSRQMLGRGPLHRRPSREVV